MQHDAKVKGVAQQPRSKYVFAGHSDEGREPLTKVCPRCGQLLFADMDVCYGCLYDFSRDQRPRSSATVPTRGHRAFAVQVPLVDDSLDSIALDEVDDLPQSDGERQPEAMPAAKARHRRTAAAPDATADDTLDLSAGLAKGPHAPAGGLAVLVSSPTMRVCVPVPEEGLMVGRDEANDIVLRSRIVSRNHLRLVPADGALVMEDLGATNPALVLGAPIGEHSRIAAGQSVAVCDTTLTVVARGFDSGQVSPKAS